MCKTFWTSHVNSFEVKPAPKWLPILQWATVFYSVAVAALLLYEVSVINTMSRTSSSGSLAAFLIYRMSVPVRFFASSGLFITAIFYMTEKVVVMNIMSAVLSAIGCFWFYGTVDGST